MEVLLHKRLNNKMELESKLKRIEYVNESNCSNKDIYENLLWMNEEVLRSYGFKRIKELIDEENKRLTIKDNYILLKYQNKSDSFCVFIPENNSEHIKIFVKNLNGEAKCNPKSVFEHLLKNEGLLEIKLNEIQNNEVKIQKC